MKKYVGIYEFDVVRSITDGKMVYMLDRADNSVESVNDMRVADALLCIAEAGKNHDRFAFWYVEEQEEKEND
jgi:hypothetical protein